MISASLSNAIDKGLQIASVLHPHIKNLNPKVDEIIVKGMESAQNAKELLDRGIKLSNEAEQKVEIIKNAVGDILEKPSVPAVQPEGAGFRVAIPLGINQSEIPEPESPEFVG